MEHPTAERYGLQAIVRSLFHFVLGKGVSATAAFAVLVIAIRQLTPVEFAVYTSMHAMVLIIGLLSSFGTNQVLMRFLPELRARGNIVAMYRLLFRGITARGLSYAAIAFLLYTYSEPICRAFKFDAWVDVVQLYCIVGFLRINGTFIGSALESLLWQREAQYSAAVSGLSKLLMVLVAVRRGGMDLADFVAIEIASEFVLLSLILGSAIVRWKLDPERHLGDLNVLREDRRRYRLFAFWSYAQNLTSVGFGSAPNRIFASYFLPIDAVATFGVIDRFIDFVRRYEPLNMFVGMVRPVLNSRFDDGKGFNRIIAAANLLFRANLLILIAPFVIVAVAGNSLFAWLTGGKYDNLTLLFLGFFVVAIVASIDSILDIIVKLLEETRIYSVGNIVRSSAIGLAIPFIYSLGLWSLVIANLLGLLIAYAIILIHLRRRGHAIKVDWQLIIRIVAYAAFAIGAGLVLSAIHVSIALAAVSSGVVFVVLNCLWPPLQAGEIRLVKDLARSSFRRIVPKR